MLVAPEFQGLDLPIHDADADVLTKDQLWDGHKLETPTFIRTVGLRLHTQDTTLAEVLTITDQELEIAAELSGALVVRHQWGLQPYPWDISYGLKGMPPGHRLVAEVDTLMFPTTGERLLSAAEKCSTGVKTYNQLMGVRLDDIRYDQFRWGYRRAGQDQWKGAVALGQKPEPAALPQMHLVDIEPRLRNIR